MAPARSSHLVETDWLADHLDAPDLVVLDGSWHLPTAGRNARAEYEEEHIPGALFFDIDEISDETSSLPHMLPSTVKFASRMKRMGIGDGMRIVVYDSVGMFSAARVWWTFRVMGHEDVAVLNGGLPKWKAEGRPVTSEPTPPRSQRHFTPRLNASLVRDLQDVKRIIESGSRRSPMPEARDGLRARSRSLVPACVAATSPARGTFLIRACSIRMARSSRPRVASGLHGGWDRPDETRRHDLRLGRDRGYSQSRTRLDRAAGLRPLRRLVERMGPRGRRHARRAGLAVRPARGAQPDSHRSGELPSVKDDVLAGDVARVD